MPPPVWLDDRQALAAILVKYLFHARKSGSSRAPSRDDRGHGRTGDAERVQM
jgi:hypothetical protein